MISRSCFLLFSSSASQGLNEIDRATEGLRGATEDFREPQEALGKNFGGDGRASEGKTDAWTDGRMYRNYPQYPKIASIQQGKGIAHWL